MQPSLPEGHLSRPGRPEDIPALAALEADYARQLFGRALRTESELRTEWKAPTFDPATDSRVVLDPDGRVIGWAEIYDSAPHVAIPSRLRIAPDASESGAAECLLAWCIDRAREAIPLAPAGTRVSFTQGAFEADPAAKARLLRADMRPIRSFLRMQIEMKEPPEAPSWPEGVRVRVFVPGQDDEPALHVARDVFSDHWGHVETPFEEDLAEWRT
jgi:mycothiol synthase